MWLNKVYAMSSNKQTSEVEYQETEMCSLRCLNCGAMLKGKYCHECGQLVTTKMPSVKDFILEYLNNAFIWDTQFFTTIGRLVRRPGLLTNEFMSGRFVSQEHPLKLNMFLLFVFITMFVLFSGGKKADDTLESITTNEMAFPSIQLSFLSSNEEFIDSVATSPRDTIVLRAPLDISVDHSHIVRAVDVIEDSHGKGLDTWTAVVPRTLIEDGIVILNDDNQYVFSQEKEVVVPEFDELKSVLKELNSLISTYFPFIILLTTPLLARSISIIQRKNRKPFLRHYIFALHYTAFIELLIILIYALFLVVDLPFEVLQWILRVGSSIYLVMAVRRVYHPDSWIKSIFKAIVTYITYLSICALIFFVIVIAICFYIAINAL